jgi:hypothetical protein
MGTAVRRAEEQRRTAHPIRARGHERAHRKRSAPGSGRNLRGTRSNTQQPRCPRGYDKVNDLLADVEAEIRRSFLTEAENLIDDSVEAVVHLISSWDIEKARDFAWLNVQTLWELRRIGPLYGAYTATLARTVGMGSRLLLTSPK